MIFLAGGIYPLSNKERLTTVTEPMANLLEKKVDQKIKSFTYSFCRRNVSFKQQ